MLEKYPKGFHPDQEFYGQQSEIVETILNSHSFSHVKLDYIQKEKKYFHMTLLLYTVEPRYLELAYFELPHISK